VCVRKSDAQEVRNFIDEKPRTKTDENEKKSSQYVASWFGEDG
jgi:hypothetical protein